MTRTPVLPSLYELVPHEVLDSAVAEARRLVAAGADEGTLVWVREQTAGKGRSGQPWASPRGNLYCALVLRPDYPFATAMQLNYVAAVALGTMLAGMAAPWTNLRYRWPNDVLLNSAKVAAVTLDAAATGAETLDWLILGIAVNVKSHPADTIFPASNLIEEARAEVSEIDVLEGFSRHFLSWINRWAEEGFAPVLRAWMQRADNIGETREITVQGEVLSGTFTEVDELGAMVLQLDGGKRRLVTVGDYFRN